MKKHIITTLSIAALFALPQLVLAGQKGEPAFGGKVTAVAEGTITVSNKKAGDKTFKTGADTKYAKSDKTDAAAADIKVGSMVKVKAGADPDQAAAVTLLVPVKKDAAKESKNGGAKDGEKDSARKNSKDAPKETPQATPNPTPKDAPKETGAAPASTEKPAN